MRTNKEIFCKGIYKSPIGILEITATDKGIRKISFSETPVNKISTLNPIIENCKKELNEYFEGERKNFGVKLDLAGTEFQKLVWMTLTTIPYGETVTYLKIAELIGDTKSVRAVGMANSRNCVPVIVPCHRVVGSNGNLTGYAGGLWRKDWLLKHELQYSKNEKQLDLF
ncbi:MAG: methylated-DNA--[protein]-cysteine S-methyltransferase [Melioribacteraceae bacterium]|nr:methylated-DNA--[protein]-cysteine S-methyltransferase [Melioribacteraceae bacterium]